MFQTFKNTKSFIIIGIFFIISQTSYAATNQHKTSKINQKLSKVCQKEKGTVGIEHTGLFTCKIKNNDELISKKYFKKIFKHPLNSPFLLVIWDVHNNHFNNALNIESKSHKVQKIIKTKNYTIKLYALNINIISRKNKKANYKLAQQSVINKIAADTRKELN